MERKKENLQDFKNLCRNTFNHISFVNEFVPVLFAICNNLMRKCCLLSRDRKMTSYQRDYSYKTY